MRLPGGQLVRARRQVALRANTVFVDDGRVLTVRGSTSVDRCPHCGVEGAQVGILSDGSYFHSMPDDICDKVFPPC